MAGVEGIGPEQVQKAAVPKKEGLFAKLFAGLLQNGKHSIQNPANELEGMEPEGPPVPEGDFAGVSVKRAGGKRLAVLRGKPADKKADPSGFPGLSGPVREEIPAPAGEEAGEKSVPGAEQLLSRIVDPFQREIAAAMAETTEWAEPPVEIPGETPSKPAAGLPVEKPADPAGETMGAEKSPHRLVLEKTDPGEPEKAAPQGKGDDTAGDTAGPAFDAGTVLVSHEQDPAEKGQSPAETRGRKSRDRLTLEVRDLRTEPSEPVRGGPEAESSSGEGRETELIVELRSGRGRQEGSDIPREGRPAASSFEDTLARELQQNLNGDIVRHASLVLKDGGGGTIKLSLKPETLGNVKIHLEMTENKIAGRIVVENDEVLRAFEREMRSLEQAFKDSGFEGASLEMALASGDAGRQGEKPEPDFYENQTGLRLAAAGYDAAGDRLETIAYSGAGPETRINMLV
jgi:hypothetical protein